MDRIIWIVEENREKLLDAQRKINAYGAMKAMCILSADFMKRVIEERIDKDEESLSTPSLILVDEKLVRNSEDILNMLKMHSKLAGVPLFFMLDEIDGAKEEECYLKGAMVVIEKPLSKSALVKIESASWQYERSKNYEKILQKQISELESAKAIKKLNLQLKNRNEFLYRIFGKYFSDELLDIILSKQEGDLIGGEKKEVAILFSDLRGFTSVSENMEPEDITDLLNCYFGKMSEIIIRYGGTIIEFLGDGILAVFGAPVANEKYCANAIAAAINMQNAMAEVNDYCNEKGYESLKMGIGLHCGEGFVGNVGTERMMRYNVLGSVVNTCSRIEAYNIGGQVMASEDIMKRANEKLVYTDEILMQAKGMQKSVKICAITGIGGDYNCYLDRLKDDKYYTIDDDIELEIVSLDNKVVNRLGIKSKLLECSKNRISIEFADKHNMEPYMDVQVKTSKNDENVSFFEVYGKVREVYGKQVVISLTRVTDEYKSFVKDIENGKIKLKLEWRKEMKNREDFLVVSVGEDEQNDLESFFGEKTEKFILAYQERKEEVFVCFYSKDKSVRALEFVDFLVDRSAAVKGDGMMANAIISKLIINVSMSEYDTTDLQEFFNKKVDDYYEKCDWIFANEYIKENEKNILQYDLYKKKVVPWAFVKTTDIVSKGEGFKMKSLENETDMYMVADEELYIMIGCRGEIYNISKEKFDSTYEKSNEKFDIFSQMPDYIPEVIKVQNDEYVSLDDKAYLCYPKDDKRIYAKPIELRTKVFSEHNKGEYFVGRPGDYLAVREDDITDMYIIQREIFLQTYEKTI